MTRSLLLAALAATVWCGSTMKPAVAAEPQPPAPERQIVPMPDGNLPAEQIKKLEKEGWQLESIANGAAVFTRKPAPAKAVSGSGVQIEMLDDLGVVVLRGDRTRTQQIARLLGGVERAAPKTSAGIDALVRERLDTLRELVSYTDEAYRSGKTTYRSVMEAQNTLISAELESASRRADRIALLRTHVENLKKLEEIAASQQQAGQSTLADLLLAKAARLEAEIALGRESLQP